MFKSIYKPSLIVLCCLLVVFVAAGCGSAATTTSATSAATTTTAAAATTTAAAGTTTTAAPGKDPSKLKVALCMEGMKAWPGWYNQAIISLRKLEAKYGFKADISEMVTFDTMETVFTQYAEQGYDLVIAHGSLYDLGVPQVAEKYPKTKFLNVGGRYKGVDNVVSYDYNWRDTTYLWGYLSAKMSKTGTIGMTIGEPFPTVSDLALGCKVGFLEARPDGKFLYNVSGTWGDPDKGKETALAQIDSGADVTAAWSGTTGQGVGTAAESRGTYYIAEDQDRLAMFPKAAIAGTHYTFDKPYMEGVELLLSGNWKSSLTVIGMSAENAAYLDFKMSDLVPSDIKQQVEEEKQRMIAAGGVSKYKPDVAKYAIGDVKTWWEVK